MSVFAAGILLGASLTLCALFVSPYIGRRHTPPACPFEDIPPEPPRLRAVPSRTPSTVVQRRRAYDWQRDGAA
jgi:hypothetical protein